MTQDIGVYIAVVTAIVAAYLTYRNQLRLKSFELLHERRVLVLNDVESFLKNLYKVQIELEDGKSNENIKKYLNEYFHEGLILMHKIKGSNFGETADTLTDTFYSVLNEPAINGVPMSNNEAKSWIVRTINGLSAAYGFSHRQLTNELELMAFSPITRFINKHKKKAKIAIDKR